MTEQEIREDERRRVLACVIRWLDIKNQYRKCPNCMYRGRELQKHVADPKMKWFWEPAGAAPEATTGPDVSHSSLLRRLLEGQKPFKVPPPRSYSYPNTDLAAGKPIVGDELWFTEGSWLHTNKPHVVIAQSPYLIVEKKSETDLIVEWEESGERFSLQKKKVSGHSDNAGDPEGRWWVLQRIGDPPEYLP